MFAGGEENIVRYRERHRVSNFAKRRLFPENVVCGSQEVQYEA
jgi:hypothetical protein